MPATLKTMEVFTNWNTATLTPFTVIAVATTTPRILLFTVSSDEALKEIGSFPLHSSVQSISMCSVQGSKKIMAVPDDTSEPITIYNVEISQDEAQFWYVWGNWRQLLIYLHNASLTVARFCNNLAGFSSVFPRRILIVQLFISQTLLAPCLSFQKIISWPFIISIPV